MGSVTQGARNAFRNVIRTVAVVLILALSIGLALVMLMSYQAVQAKISSVKSTIGNTVTVTPAGVRGFEGGGELLTAADAKNITSIPHVKKVTASLSDRLRQSENTTLASAIEPGSFGERQREFNRSSSNDSNAQAPPDNGNSQSSAQQARQMTQPIFVTGTDDVANAQLMGGNKPTITLGASYKNRSDENLAIVGKSLATKNALKVGSTFTAYNTTFTVKGIYTAGSDAFSNAGIIMPLKTLQTLSGQTDQISTISVTADSISSVSSVKTAVEKKLGDKVDVVSSQDSSEQALEPLENIKTITMYSLIGALVAGSVIIFLTMLMIVRERKREIGILKALGASNSWVVVQFMTESFVLTFLSGIVGAAVGIALSNPVLNMLVTSNTSTTTTAGQGSGPGMMVRFMPGLNNAVQNIQTTVGYEVILYGLLAVFIIAVLGTAIPAWLTARIRPAEAMRSE